MSNIALSLARHTMLRGATIRYVELAERGPLPPRATRIVAMETEPTAHHLTQRRSVGTGEREREGNAARRIARELADGYWSTSRLLTQVLAFAIAAGSLLLVDATLTATIRMRVVTVPILLVCALLFSACPLMAWMMSRASRTGARLGAAAMVWADHARGLGAPTDLGGGWRRAVRMVVAWAGLLASAAAVISGIVIGVRPSSSGGAGWVGVVAWLVLIAAAATACCIALLRNALRGLAEDPTH